MKYFGVILVICGFIGINGILGDVMKTEEANIITKDMFILAVGLIIYCIEKDKKNRS